VHIGASHADDCGMLHYATGTDVVTIDYVRDTPEQLHLVEPRRHPWLTRPSRGNVGEVNSLNPDHQQLR
jgi:hypothetical protein